MQVELAFTSGDDIRERSERTECFFMVKYGYDRFSI